MNMSWTYQGLYVMAIGLVLQKFGMQVSENEIMQWITVFCQVGGLVWSIIGRFRQGDVNLFGVKKR